MTSSRIELVLIASLSACIDTSVTSCGDGRVCPAGRVCEPIHTLCVLPGQLTACSGLDNGITCDLPDGRTGTCDQNVCIENACGDGLVTGSEQCEPGIGMTFDCAASDYYSTTFVECNAACVFPVGECGAFCGDGVLQADRGELCEGDMKPPGACTDFGYEAGRVGCNAAACGHGLDLCRNIGFTPLVASTGINLLSAYVAAPGHVFMSQEPNLIVEVKDGTIVNQFVLPYAATNLWGLGPTSIFAVVGNDGIWRYDGTAWTRVLAKSGLYDIWGSAANDLYAVAQAGVIMRFNGSTWAEATVGTKQWSALHGTSATSIYAVGYDGTVAHWNGAMWSPVDASACWAGIAEPDFVDVWSSSANDVFVTSIQGTLCHYDGIAWTRQPTPIEDLMQAVWGRGPNDVFASVYATAILHYDGTSWRAVGGGSAVGTADIHGLGDEVVFVGADGRAHAYAGASIEREVIPETDTEAQKVVAHSDEAPVYTMTYRHLYERRQSGWVDILQPTTVDHTFTDVWAHAGGIVALQVDFTNSSAASIHYTPSAAPVVVAAPFLIRRLDGRSSTELYAISGTKVVKYASGSWSEMTTLTNFGARDLAVGPTTIWVVGGDVADTVGGMMRHDSTTGWTNVTPPNTPPLRAVWAASDTDVFAVGHSGTIMHFDGTTWTRMPSPAFASLEQIDGSSGSDVFATARTGGLTQEGHVYHYDGVEWTRMLGFTRTSFALDVHPRRVLFGGSQGVPQVLVRDSSW